MVSKRKIIEPGVKGLSISDKDQALLQTLLLQRKEMVLNQVKDLENRWQEMSEPQIEIEEMAQAVEIADPYDRLDEIERREVREIELALKKLDTGMFGICEACGRPITMKRLKAIPWTRYCPQDAATFEKFLEIFPPAVATDIMTPGRIPGD
ncbi:MAG: TraR/DksA C4-type zinc finger protein [Deltaproteobacteria bacterium]|nr:TraR/DksA C4-type zinc finger protein [Deltaproteobacteria bacterium]